MMSYHCWPCSVLMLILLQLLIQNESNEALESLSGIILGFLIRQFSRFPFSRTNVVRYAGKATTMTTTLIMRAMVMNCTVDYNEK